MTAYTQPYIKPTSFAEVENIYNRTKPMRGKNKDLRIVYQCLHFAFNLIGKLLVSDGKIFID